MQRHVGVVLVILLFNSVAAWAQLIPETLEPYPLPSKAQQALNELAEQTDIQFYVARDIRLYVAYSE